MRKALSSRTLRVHGRAEADEPRLDARARRRGVDALRSPSARSSGVDQVGDQRVDDAADAPGSARSTWPAPGPRVRTRRDSASRHSVDARRARSSVEQAGLEAVVDVVAVVGDLVGEIDDLRFQARRAAPASKARDQRPVVARRVLDDALAHLPGQVEAAKARVALLEHVDDAQALRVVLEAAVRRHQVVEHALAGVAERRVAEVVRQRDRFGEVLVQTAATRAIVRVICAASIVWVRRVR